MGGVGGCEREMLTLCLSPATSFRIRSSVSHLTRGEPGIAVQLYNAASEDLTILITLNLWSSSRFVPTTSSF